MNDMNTSDFAPFLTEWLEFATAVIGFGLATQIAVRRWRCARRNKVQPGPRSETGETRPGHELRG
jgi:hypothetical protein